MAAEPQLDSLSHLSVEEVRRWAMSREGEAILGLLERDERAGVRSVGRSVRRRLSQASREQARFTRMLETEARLRAQGVVRIAGVDEAGRGPLAGPVVAAAVVLPPDGDLRGLDDSKKLPATRREALFGRIREQAITWAIGVSQPEEIDRINILQATLKAMREAVAGLAVVPERVLVDGNQLPGTGLRELAFVDGDARCLSIAAASVMAKVTRDRMMAELDVRYPGYGFAAHKGYSCASHLAALRDLGPSPIHRMSFSPVSVPPGSPTSPMGARQAVGRRGEEIAAALLAAKGFSIRARNFRVRGGEIDIVAQREDVIAFVEVKTGGGGGLGTPEARVGPEKQRRMLRAARQYLAREDLGPVAPRFDVVAVSIREKTPRVEHLEGAFRLG